MQGIYNSTLYLKQSLALIFLCFFINNISAGNIKPKTPSKRVELTISVNQTSVSCYGEIDGKAYVTVNGGVAPYLYSWSNNGVTDTISNLTAGVYTVTVEDSEGVTVSGSVEVTEPGLLFGNFILSDSVLTCDVTELTATFEPIGGTFPYIYEWSFPQGVIEMGQTVNIFQPATYPLKVTDANGCIYESETVITSENIPVVLLELVDTVSCNGLSDGSASSTVTGGVEPYFYSWSNGDTTPNLEGVSSGSYSVTVTDAEGCSGKAFVFIPQPASLTLTVTGNDVTCFGQSSGAIFTTISGGTPNYEYLWNDGSTTAQLNNIEAGIYEVTVTDAHGCTVTGGVTITEGNEINIFTNSSPVTCFGGNNGQATVFATGGAGVFMYNWSNGGTGAQITNLIAGTYLVYVTDAKNCVESTSVVVAEPSEIILTMNSTPEVLGGQDGTATVSVYGGVSPYKYLWETGSTLPSINNLTAGIYLVTVTDLNNCVKVDSVEVLASNCAFAGSLVIIDPSCFGTTDGAIFPQIDVPGLEPYFYQWSNNTNDVILEDLAAGTYSVTIYDNANCIIKLTGTLINPAPVDVQFQITQPTGPDNPTGSITLSLSGGTPPYKAVYNGTEYPGGSSITIVNIPSGPQSLIAKDSKGCQVPVSFIIDQFDCQLTTEVVKISEPICNGLQTGKACVMYDNNFGPVTIEWSNDKTTECIDNLGAGLYMVTVRDTLGCTSTKEITIEEPDPIQITNVVIVVGSGNSDGSIKLNVIGGTPPFTYKWTKDGQAYSTQRDIVNINGGNYVFQVTDSKGCLQIFEAFSIIPSADRTLVINDGIKMYPNPSSGLMTIETGQIRGSIKQIFLTDINGNKKSTSFQTGDQHNLIMDMSSLTAGSYMIHIITESGIYNGRVIKVN